MVTDYQLKIRSIEVGTRQPTQHDYIDSEEVATKAFLKIGDYIFSGIVTEQIYSPPCTVIVAAIATYLY